VKDGNLMNWERRNGMKTLIAVVLAGFLATTWVCWAEEQGDVFSSMRCGVCHKAEKSTKSFPSLKEIAKAYEGKEAQLAAYFQGKGESILRPEGESRMKNYIEKTKALSDADQKALVDFIMSHNG
jgi:cytochrome c551/c552